MPLDEHMKSYFLSLCKKDKEELLGFLLQQMTSSDDDSVTRRDIGELSNKPAYEDNHGVNVEYSQLQDESYISFDSQNTKNSAKAQRMVITETDGMIQITVPVKEFDAVEPISSVGRSDRSDSVASSSSAPQDASAISTIVEAQFNRQVIVDMDPTKDAYGGMIISFTSESTNTSLGPIQGDHTIPSRNILEFTANIVMNKTLQDIKDLLGSVFLDRLE